MVPRIGRLPRLPPVMLVWDGAGGQAGLDRIAQAVDGGLGLLQLRAPKRTDTEQVGLLAELKRRFPSLILLVNRRLDVVREAGVGLHLPEADPLPTERPSGLLWGRSVHGMDMARAAEREGACYLVLGTIFPTPGKPGHPGAGLDLIREVSSSVRLPVFAIGGLDAARAGSAIAAGAYGVAVQRAILDAADPRAATRLLNQKLDSESPIVER